MTRARGWRTAALLGATALIGSLAASRPAAAQDAAALQAIQAQITQLQAELKRLQRQAAERDTALKRAQQDATQARAEASRALQRSQAAPPTQASAAPPAPAGGGGGGGFAIGTPNPNATSLQGPSPASITATSVDANKPTIRVGNVTITLGGYLDTTAIYRSRNLTSGTGSPYNSIPYANSPNGHIDEFRVTSQPSRLSMLVQGKISDSVNIAGYSEFDLNSAATTANSNQTNSYNPRVRVVYATYDDSKAGWHLLVGQNWSLAVGNKTGIIPRQENIPLEIDANYVPGWVYTRQPQIRVAKDFGGKYWLAASLEAPEETYSFAGATSSTSVPNLVLPPFAGNPSESLSYNTVGGTYLNSTASYSYDTAPDIILKAAADPGYGHYEVFGLGRFFKSRTSIVGAGTTRVSFGGGVGGSAVIPVVPKYVDLVGNVLWGAGVGRYGASALPDATFKANGDPAPLREIAAMAGIVGHPVKDVDLYTYVGMEQLGRSTFTTGTGRGTAGFGYGTAYANTSGCNTELGTTCAAQTREVEDITVGAWWRFLHGNYGTVQAGAAYSYVKKIAFHGSAGRPTTDDNIAFFTLRYLPFQ